MFIMLNSDNSTNFNIKTLSNNSSYLEIQGCKSKSIDIKIKKIADKSLRSKIWTAIKEKISKNKHYLKINIDGELLEVKVTDLTNKIGVSREKVVEAYESGSISRLLKVACEAKNFNTSFSLLDSFFDSEESINRLSYLEFLSESLHLPLSVIVKAESNGSLELVVKEAQEIEDMCHSVFERLDVLYAKEEGRIYTKNNQENIKGSMTAEELNAVKETIRVAFKILKSTPPSNKKIEQVISITENHKILVESSENSYKVTGLFGKILGFGGAGVALHSINLLEGSWNNGDMSVLKVSQITDPGSEQIIQEEKIIKKVHGENLVLGIQKPLKLIKNVFSGIAKHCHLGRLYETDLSKILFDPETKHELTKTDMLSMSYQLMYGVFYMHKVDITSGDIKPENVFCDLGNFGPRVYLSDFGGAIDHGQEFIPLQETTSIEYRTIEDDIASKNAYLENDKQQYLEIEKKADVFATCSTIYCIFTKTMPYNPKPGISGWQLKSNLEEELENSGLSQKTIKLIIQGLDKNYKNRPDAIVILEAIKNDLITFDPDLCQHLENMS